MASTVPTRLHTMCNSLSLVPLPKSRRPLTHLAMLRRADQTHSDTLWWFGGV